jgi:hypothetical protein
MPISVVCPSCSAKIKAPDAAAGKRLPCPKCKQPFVVETRAEGAPPTTGPEKTAGGDGVLPSVSFHREESHSIHSNRPC